MNGPDTETLRTKSIADMLPELTDLLSQNTLMLTAKKKPRNNITTAPISRTIEKFKPLTIAEMRADIDAIRATTGKKRTQQPTTTMPNIKKWNSSIKIDKKRVSHTGDGQMMNNPVRKVLNFQTKAQIATPKFPKPELRAKKSIHMIRAKETVRISGVYNIPETPRDMKQPVRSRMTIANKENIPSKKYIPRPSTAYIGVNRKNLLSPKPLSNRKTIVPRRVVPDTPISNDSWKSSCDASFLQKEKEIDDHEQNVQVIVEERVLENIAELTPPVSTPFKEYRNVEEYFNNSSEIENSVNNDTIMCFEKPSASKQTENLKEEEIPIVSLCDLFKKATVTNNDKSKTDLEILLQIKSDIENTLKSHLNMLKYIDKLIEKKKKGSNSPISLNATVTESVSKLTIANVEENTEKFKRCSVIRSPIKSPVYRIPKKNICLRKKMIYKSMPDISTAIQTPVIDNSDKAMSMYMKMKEKMNFLNTPLTKKKPMVTPDTPALTSQNLQMQLDKLFNNS